jgi:hypothetical protein
MYRYAECSKSSFWSTGYNNNISDRPFSIFRTNIPINAQTLNIFMSCSIVDLSTLYQRNM